MDKKIIRYKTFNTDEEFSEWQLENEVNIFTIQPMVTSFAMKGEYGVEADGTVNISIFVTYTVCN